MPKTFILAKEDEFETSGGKGFIALKSVLTN